MVCRQRRLGKERTATGAVGGKNTPPGSGPTPRPWLRKNLKLQTRQADGSRAPGPSQAVPANQGGSR